MQLSVSIPAIPAITISVEFAGNPVEVTRTLVLFAQRESLIGSGRKATFPIQSLSFLVMSYAESVNTRRELFATETATRTGWSIVAL